MQRLEALQYHISANPTFNAEKLMPQLDDDVVIIGMARTAITKSKRGAQKDTKPEEMLVPVL